MQKRLVVLLALLMLATAACGGELEDPAGGRSRRRAAESPPPSPSPPPPPTCPLTGTPAPAGLNLARPVHAVKIDNHPASRPQVGMLQADVIYEELVEGGLTRFLVVFHCQDAQRLGPIRSARLVDPDLLVLYSPVLFGYSGAAPPVTAKVRSTAGVIDLAHGNNGPAYARSGGRAAPHNLYTSSANLLGRPAAQGVQGNARTGYEFDEAVLNAPPPAAPPAAAPASPGAPPPPPPPPPPGAGVDLAYSGGSRVSYNYDPGTKRYLRNQGGQPHRDESGQQLSAVNVLVFKVPVQLVGGSAHITVVGESEAIVLRGGQAVQGRWRRPSLGDQYTLVDAAGQPIKLAPGNIFVNLVPVGQPVTVR